MSVCRQNPPGVAEQVGPPSDNRVDVVIGVVARGGRVLICQRPEGKSFGGYWEFPGGKREHDETCESCLRRELREELGIDVTPVRALTPVDHNYPRGRIRLVPFVCTQVDTAEPRPLECQRAVWIRPAELRDYHFPPANEALIEEVIAHFAANPERSIGG